MYYRTSCLVCIQQNAGSKEKEPSNIGLNCKIYNVNFESNCANDQKKTYLVSDDQNLLQCALQNQILFARDSSLTHSIMRLLRLT